MIRDINISEISDGRFYQSSDMVRVDTGGCTGCSRCCSGMGDSIILDPYDIYRLQMDAGISFGLLMDCGAEFGLADGLVLPHLAMTGPGEMCAFLNAQGRCSIHAARPGLCRLFPLGRYYEGDDYRYFLQIHECSHAKTKVKVKRWLDTPDLGDYESYIRDWHRLLRMTRERIAAAERSDPDSLLRKQLSLLLLRLFYQQPWEKGESFYSQYGRRQEAMAVSLGGE